MEVHRTFICLFIFILIAIGVLLLGQLKNINKQIVIELQNNQKELQNNKKVLQSAQKQLIKINIFLTSNRQKITVSAYHPPSRGINSDSDPTKTATMKKPVAGRTLAISDELFNLGWLGRRIYIDGWGVGKATDRMDSSVKGRQIDICAPTLKIAKKMGIRKNVLAIVLD